MVGWSQMDGSQFRSNEKDSEISTSSAGYVTSNCKTGLKTSRKSGESKDERPSAKNSSNTSFQDDLEPDTLSSTDPYHRQPP